MTSSIIVNIIQEALLADPEHAQLIVQEYFQSNDMNKDYLDIFQRCWSKTLLGYESFRTRDQREQNKQKNYLSAHAHQFAVDFVDELIKHDKDLQIMRNTILDHQNEVMAMMKVSSQRHDNSTDIVSTQRIEYHQQFKQNLEISFEKMKIDDYSLYIDYHDQIRQWKFQHALHLRSHLQNYRISMKETSTITSTYNPLHKRYYKQTDQKMAELHLKASNTTREVMAMILSFSLAIGISIAYSPEHDRRIWTTYQALSEVMIYPPLNILPIPIQNQIDSITSTRVFMFDCPSTRNLAEISSPVLAICLKKNPLLLLTWIYQMQATRLAFITSPYQLLGQLTYQDTFIRDDGRLLIGNIALTSKDEGSKPSCDVFDNWAYDTLTHALCVSRHEKLCFYRLRDIDEKKHRQVISMAIMEGHELALKLPDHLNGRKIIIPSSSSEAISSSTYISVTVVSVDSSPQMETYKSTSRVSAESIELLVDAASSAIMLKASKATTISLTISSIVNGEEDEICQLHVSVIPYYAIRSGEVAEMLAALKLAHHHRKPSMMFTCTASISTQRLINYIQSNRFDSQKDEIKEQWISVCRAINI